MEKKLVPNTNDTIFKAMYRGLDDNNENAELNLEIKKDFLEFYKKYCNTNSKLQPADIRPFNLLEKKVLKRMGKDSMVNAMVAVEDEEDRECLLAQVTLDFIKEREYRKKAEEQAQRITAQAQILTEEKQRIAVQAQKLTAENEEFKNILIKTSVHLI